MTAKKSAPHTSDHVTADDVTLHAKGVDAKAAATKPVARPAKAAKVAKAATKAAARQRPRPASRSGLPLPSQGQA